MCSNLSAEECGICEPYIRRPPGTVVPGGNRAGPCPQEQEVHCAPGQLAQRTLGPRDNRCQSTHRCSIGQSTGLKLTGASIPPCSNEDLPWGWWFDLNESDLRSTD